MLSGPARVLTRKSAFSSCLILGHEFVHAGTQDTHDHHGRGHAAQSRASHIPRAQEQEGRAFLRAPDCVHAGGRAGVDALRIHVDNWFPMFGTYMFGDIAASFYLAVYYTYTTERPYVIKFVLALVGWIVISTLYVVLASNELIGDKHTAYKITGYIGVVGSLVLYASPFDTMVQVVRSRNAISIPILMVCVGTVSNILWTVYGLATDDWFVTIPNGTTVIFGVVHIVLYVMYNPKKTLDQRLPMMLSPVDDKMTTQWELIESPTPTRMVFRFTKNNMVHKVRKVSRIRTYCNHL